MNPYSSPLSGQKILIVEDEAMIAMLLEDMVETLGLQVVGVASSVDQAISMIKGGGLAIDVALLDINLGGERVFPVADALLEQKIPFAFCSGYGRPGESNVYNAVPTITKPFTMDQLKKVLTSLCSRRPAP